MDINQSIENLDFIRTTQSDGTEFLEVKKDDLKALLISISEQTRKEEQEEFVAQLHIITSQGAPSEQGDVIKYGAKVWEDVHKLRELYEKRLQILQHQDYKSNE